MAGRRMKLSRHHSRAMFADHFSTRIHLCLGPCQARILSLDEISSWAWFCLRPAALTVRRGYVQRRYHHMSRAWKFEIRTKLAPRPYILMARRQPRLHRSRWARKSTCPNPYLINNDGFVKSPKTIFGIHHDVVDHLISSIYCSIVFHFGLFTKPSIISFKSHRWHLNSCLFCFSLYSCIG